MGTGHRQTWFYNSVTVLQGGRKLWATPPLVLHKGMDICLTQRTLQMVFPQPSGSLSAQPSFWLKLVSPLSSGLAGHCKIPNHCLTLLQFLTRKMDFPYWYQAQPVLVSWLWVWYSAICVFNSKSIFPPHCSSGLLGFHPTSQDRFKQKFGIGQNSWLKKKKKKALIWGKFYLDTFIVCPLFSLPSVLQEQQLQIYMYLVNWTTKNKWVSD